MKKFAWAENLTRLNRLALLDVLLDAQEELQLNPQRPTMRYFRQIIRFQELFPGDSINMRDQYMETRWKAMQTLQQRGIFKKLAPVKDNFAHRWESVVAFSGSLSEISALIDFISACTFRRPLTVRLIGITRQLLPLLTGAFAATAYLLWKKELGWMTAALALLWAAFWGVFPWRWKGNLQEWGAIAGIMGTVIATVALVWTILHTH